MQARTNPPSSGRAWVGDGWRLFRLQPFGFIVLLFTYLSGILLAHLVLQGLVSVLTTVLPFLPAEVLTMAGSMFIIIIVPGLSVGFAEGCRRAGDKAPLPPQLLFKAFTIDRATSRGLLVLGAVYSVAMAVVIAVASNVDLPAIPAGKGPITPLPPEVIYDILLQRGLAMLLYLPVAMALWYSPLLVAWHRMSPLKAMFFSVAACWRNRGAFVVYGMTWFLIGMPLSLIGALLLLLGFGEFSFFLIMPLVVPMIVSMYCSTYSSYTAVLVDETAQVDPLPLS